MIIEIIRQILHVGIGFIFGITIGIIIATFGLVEVFSILSPWMIVLLAVLFSSGLFGIYSYVRNPNKIKVKKYG